MEFYNGKPFVYLDNAATTKPDKEVVKYINDFLTTNFFNPSSAYDGGEYVRNEIENARCTIANFINSKPSEIYFTSGGTESDNWALKGILEKGDHVITSCIEHKAILNTCKALENQGVEVTYLDVDNEYGEINLLDLEKAIKPNTKLISIMFVNNEIGSVNNLDKISAIAKKHNILFHTDAVQGFGKYPIDVNKIGIDMMSASSHKINGIKGCGFLYISDGIKIKNLIDGGEQESYLRGGTENVIGIIGLGKAVELLGNTKDIIDRYIYVGELSSLFIDSIKDILLDTGKLFKSRSPYIVNIVLHGYKGESIARLFDANGVCVSTGSACNTHSGNPSHVLKSVGYSDDDANSSIRFSFSHDNTKEEIEYVAKIFKQIISQLKITKNERKEND